MILKKDYVYVFLRIKITYNTLIYYKNFQKYNSTVLFNKICDSKKITKVCQIIILIKLLIYFLQKCHLTAILWRQKNCHSIP